MIEHNGHMTNIISVQGVERPDIPYYMARCINAMGRLALVLDNTRGNALFNAISQGTDTELAEAGNIEFRHNKAWSKEYFMQYDCIIIYHGMTPDRKLVAMSDFRFILASQDPSANVAIKDNILHNENVIYQLVICDKVGGKTTEDVILRELGLSNEEVTEEAWELAYSEEDYACMINLLRNGHQSPRRASSDMRNTLMVNFMKAYAQGDEEFEDKKVFNRAVRKAVKGVIR